MLRPPTHVKVGAAVYRVKSSKRAWKRRLSKSGEAHTTRGATSVHKHTIWTDPSGSEALVRETLLHEVLHALFDDSGWFIDNEDDNEEKVIRALSPRLYAVLVENPLLVAYLSEPVTPTPPQEGV